MDVIVELKQPEKAASLFSGWQETMIWSCLQGVMGRIYGDSPIMPSSAVAQLGDFCFFAGEPSREMLLNEAIFHDREFMILVPQTREWADLMEACYGSKASRVTRYAIQKEPGGFNRELLQGIVDGLPHGYQLQMMDEPLFWRCREIPWCRDWVAQYDSYAHYQRYGLGAVILKDGVPVSGASSYSSYRGGIEVEIDTREDYRRRGLACVCGAKLILECLKRGWYPSWDAQNLWSVALAEKLGYHVDHEYAAYEVKIPIQKPTPGRFPGIPLSAYSLRG